MLTAEGVNGVSTVC